jgi:putative integral membrane protein (TIGR02587 family)
VARTPRKAPRGGNTDFLIGLARAFAGALIFSLPILMTMEMWELGVSVAPFRLALLTGTAIPVLVALSYYVGFEETSTLLDDVLDASAAYAVGFFTSAGVLYLMGVLESDSRAGDVVGRIALQAVPASIGALLAQSQLGPRDEQRKRTREPGYGGNIFFMGVGALFLSFNVAPTEEVHLIAYKMNDWLTLTLSVVTLLIMHAFVYGVEFSGTPPEPRDTPGWSLFARYTVVGYAVAIAIGWYVLWIFGRFDGLDYHQVLTAAIVLGFPAAVGAAAARLIL